METYAPVVSLALVRTFLYSVLYWNMTVTRIDINTALLNGQLSENVSVISPRGIPGRKSQYHKLGKAKYGLKQVHLAWHTKVCNDLRNVNVEELRSAPCIIGLRSDGNG